MSKKFFTLLYGDKLHAAPKAKILPAESFSTVLEAGEVLEKIKKEAEKYRQEVTEECESIKEKAYKAGYEEGFKAWSEHLARLEKEAENIREETQKLVIPVALKAAKKIVAKELEISQEAIVDIVESNLRSAAQHKRITIFVNKNDLEAIEKNKPRLKKLFENLEAFSVRERNDVEPGGCIIETEIGIINAQMDHRWRILEKAFQQILKPVAPAQTNEGKG